MISPQSGEISSANLHTRLSGELPLEGWLSVELGCQLDVIGPSDQHPNLVRVKLSLPPHLGRGSGDPREEALADFISRHAELGAGIEELGRDDPRTAAAYRDLASVLVPWLVGAPQRDIEAAWKRGYDAAKRRQGKESPGLKERPATAPAARTG